MKTLTGIISLLIACNSFATELLNADFSKDKLKDAFSSYRNAKIVDGTCQMSGGDVRVKYIKVKPRQRIRMSFDARVVKGNCLEANPAMENILRTTLWNIKKFPMKLPTVSIHFANAKRNWIPYEQYCNYSLEIFSNKFRTYNMEFYVPEKAVYVMLKFLPQKNNVIAVKNIKIEEVTNAKTLNINGDFDLGMYNRFGWGYLHEGFIELNDDDKAFVEARWLVSDYIPVEEGTTFEMECVGKSLEGVKEGRIYFNFFKDNKFDLKNKVGQNKFKIALTPELKTITHKQFVPKGAKWMRAGSSGCAFHSFKLKAVSEDK